MTIEVTDATADDQKFEAGWHVFGIETDPVAPGTSSVRVVIDAACSIFYVASAIEVLGLIVDDAVVPLVALDRVEEGKREWRVSDRYADVPAGASLVFRVRNDGAESADPKIACVARNPRQRMP